MRFAALLLAVLMTMSCMKSKAAIDYTISEGIIWPGLPEKPRIKYLFSISRIAGGEGMSKFATFLTGEGERFYTDPRDSSVLINPHGLFVDDNDVLYVSDPGAMRVNVIDLKDMTSFNILRAGEVYLVSPIGVAADKERIFVTDSELAAVFAFNKKGRLLHTFEGVFKRPTGIAINRKNGNVYVADTWDHSIGIFTPEGKKIGTIGQRGEGPGKLNYPTHLAFNSDCFLYVSDTLNFRVNVFKPDGEFFMSFGVLGDSYGTFDKIKGISTDTEGNVYVVDSAQDMVKMYDEQGRLLMFFGNEGSYYGMFSLPTGIYIDSKDRVFVSDSLNRRIQTFQFLGGD